MTKKSWQKSLMNQPWKRGSCPPLLPGPTDSAAATSSQSTERLDHEASNPGGSRGGAMANPQPQKSYDYLLKVLLVGDSDVGKQEILSNLEDGIHDSPFCSSEGAGNIKNICTHVIGIRKIVLHSFRKVR